jgi:predicted ATPase
MWNKPLSQALIAEIIERTDGVPLFVEEMTKAILESGETQAAHIVSAVPSPSIGVPASLHASLMARLDRLGPAKQVAQIGAAIGREFSYELLSAAAHRKDSELVDALERLTDSGLLYREGVPPHATFLFKHALVQDAAYGTLLREARRNIHERIAEALSKTFPQTRETQPEVLAHHFTQAGLTEAAVHWWGKAGQQALVHSAMLEAEGHLRKGLNILATLPDGTERQEYELDLQMALADAVAATHGLTAPTWAETIARARLLCEKLSRLTQLAMVLASQCNLHLVRGELELACQESKELLDLGKVRNDPFATLSGCNQSALAWFCRGDFTASRGYAEQALTLYDPAIYDPANSSTVKWTIDLQATALELSCRSLTYLGSWTKFSPLRHLQLRARRS